MTFLNIIQWCGSPCWLLWDSSPFPSIHLGGMLISLQGNSFFIVKIFNLCTVILQNTFDMNFFLWRSYLYLSFFSFFLEVNVLLGRYTLTFCYYNLVVWLALECIATNTCYWTEFHLLKDQSLISCTTFVSNIFMKNGTADETLI